MAAGADIASVSMHKSCGNLAQSSLLLAGLKVHAGYVRQIINLTRTTSGSYLLMSSLDISRRSLALRGWKVILQVANMAKYARQEINAVNNCHAFSRKLTLDGSVMLAERDEFIYDRLPTCPWRRIPASEISWLSALEDERIHQFCIRSGDREEFRFAKDRTDLHLFSFDGLEQAFADLQARKPPVYFTIDLDCLNPSAFSGTDTPEAGSVNFLQLLGAIRTVCTARVVGADVNELAPMLDPGGVFPGSRSVRCCGNCSSLYIKTNFDTPNSLLCS